MSRLYYSKIAPLISFSTLLFIFLFISFGEAAAQCKKKNANKFIVKGNEFYARQDYQNALVQFNAAIKDDNQCAYAYFNKGQAERFSDQLDNAIQSINRALALPLSKDEKVTAYNSLGSIYLKKDGERGLKEAIRHSEEAVKIDPNSIDGWYVLAIANIDLKKHEESVRALNELIRLKSDDLEYRRARGTAFTNLKKYREALADFYEVAQKEPQNFLNHVFVGELYSLLGNFKPAIESLNKAVALKPDFALTYLDLGNAFLATNQYEKAAQSFRQAINYNITTMAEASMGEAFARLAIGQYKEAVDLLNQSLQYQPVIQKPDDFKATIYSALGNAHSQLADYQKAIGFYRKAKELNFEDRSADVNLSWSYSMLNENEAAVEAANRAIERKPKDYMGYTNRCRAKLELKLWDEALADCQKALELISENGETLFYYSRILKTRKRLKEAEAANKKAIASLEKELNVKPEAASTENFREFFSGDERDSELENEKPGLFAIEVKTQTPYTAYILGNAYAEDKQPNKAILAYQEAIRRSPNFPLARFNLAIVYYHTDKNKTEIKKLALEQYNALVKVDQKRAAELKKLIDGKK